MRDECEDCDEARLTDVRGTGSVAASQDPSVEKELPIASPMPRPLEGELGPAMEEAPPEIWSAEEWRSPQKKPLSPDAAKAMVRPGPSSGK